MKRRTVPLFKIGLFVVSGFIVLLVFIFYIGSQEKLFSRTTKIHARFTTVSGLKSGAQVQLSGIAIGSVTDIYLPKAPGDPVRVTFKVLDRAMPLIRTNSRAVISTEGLIGEKIVTIEPGEGAAPQVAEGGYLVGEPTKDFTQIFDTLSLSVKQINRLVDEAAAITTSIRQGQGVLGKLVTDDRLYHDLRALATESQTTMTQARVVIDNVGGQLNSLGERVNVIVQRVQAGEGSLGRLLNNDDLYRDLQATSASVRESSYDLRDAMAKLSLASGRIAEVGEAFKHNFLVKGYFEERGYWDAPQFELTIDRKLDSLNRLQMEIEERIRQVRASNK